MSNRTEIASQVANHVDVTTAKGVQAVDKVFKSIIALLALGEDVTIPGFGRFAVVHRAAREGRNPKTGAKIAVAASTTVSLKPHKGLKDALNPAPVRKVGGERNAPMRQSKRA